MVGRHFVLAGMMVVMAFTVAAMAADDALFIGFSDIVKNMDVHGFWEARAGYRTQNDPYEKDMSVMETRLQLDFSSYNDWADFKYKADVWGDGVLESAEYDTRELWFFSRPTDFMDVKIGRQVLTWGTGDLLFLNDLFPKDWQSFFIGRDTEYLKAPSDAAKFSFFTDLANVDIVYTPQFDPDRYITGEYISFWDGNVLRRAGRDRLVNANVPDNWFSDDEVAVRVYRNINNYEYALYGYWGYWKSPGGQTAGGVATFPGLNVYGASVRGQLGKGIANAEFAYYRSTDDTTGQNPLVNNSELRYLVGYTQEIGKDLNAGVQYYLEQMLDYDAYIANLPGGPARDELRHVVTFRLTKLLMNQNLRLSMFAYYSPSDRDVYLRPNIHYKHSDNLALEAGANVFFGSDQNTFFAQFERDSNIYTALRYSF